VTTMHERIGEKCREFADDISAIVQQALLSAFTEPMAKPSGLPSRAGRRPGEKRSPEDLAALTDTVYSTIKRNPGLRLEQLSDKLNGIATKELMLPILKLKGQNCLKVQGQRRGTRYWAR
jgi:hypothetical protein